MPWRIKVVWLDGTEVFLCSAGGRISSFRSRKKAEEFRDFMLEGMADEVQGIYVTQQGPS